MLTPLRSQTGRQWGFSSGSYRVVHWVLITWTLQTPTHLDPPRCLGPFLEGPEDPMLTPPRTPF